MTTLLVSTAHHELPATRLEALGITWVSAKAHAIDYEFAGCYLGGLLTSDLPDGIRLSQHDLWRPQSQPASRLYDRLTAEQLHRKSRGGVAWVETERAAMTGEAQALCTSYGLVPVSAEDVMACESQALGHTDYAAKWAYALDAAIRRQPKSKQG